MKKVACSIRLDILTYGIITDIRVVECAKTDTEIIRMLIERGIKDYLNELSKKNKNFFKLSKFNNMGGKEND
jgi:hypothetical protein